MWVDGQEMASRRDDSFNQGLAGFIIPGFGHATFSDWVVERK